MAATTDPLTGIQHSWSLGESGWNTGMDSNLKKLMVFTQLSVVDRNLTEAPASPSDGDRYIVGVGATDSSWAGQDNNIAVYNASSGDWDFYTPWVGVRAYIQDEQVISTYTDDSNGWTAGVSI